MVDVILAGCLFWYRDGIITLKRKDGSRWYEIPGGKVEPGETPEEAAERELDEELGVSLEQLVKLDTVHFEHGGISYEYHWFYGVLPESQVPRVMEPEKFERYQPIHPNNIHLYNKSPSLTMFFEKLSDGSVQLPKLT